MADYKVVQGKTRLEFEGLVKEALAEGWTLLGNAICNVGLYSQPMGLGITDAGEAAQPALRIVHKGAIGAYTIQLEDKGAYLVFDFVGDLQLSMPAIAATDENPFVCYAVNTEGRIDLIPTGHLTAYAPHASRHVTVGLMHGAVSWYATGTNVKEEDA